MLSTEQIAFVGSPDAPVTVFGLSPRERLRRQSERVTAPAGRAGWFLIIRDDVVLDTLVLQRTLEGQAVILCDPAGQPLAAWIPAGQREQALNLLSGALDPELDVPRLVSGQASFFNDKLKKRERIELYKVRPGGERDVEAKLFRASYKGVTDVVTRYLWPAPAFWVTRFCARGGWISPNLITALSVALSIVAIPLLWQGWFAWGLGAAWLMTFLDTVDGKLARVTITSSRFGHYFDHVADIVFPPVWWYACIEGLEITAAEEWFDDLEWGFVAVMASYVIGRLCEGIFELRHGFVPFLWRRFDSVFRLYLARRNPNLVILTIGLLADAVLNGYFVMAAWCVVGALVQVISLLQSELAAARAPLSSWYEKPNGQWR